MGKLKNTRNFSALSQDVRNLPCRFRRILDLETRPNNFFVLWKYTTVGRISESFHPNKHRTSLRNEAGVRFFNIRSSSQYDQKVYLYLKFLVPKNLPMSISECEEFRSVSKFECAIGVPKFKYFIIELVKLVEDRQWVKWKSIQTNTKYHMSPSRSTRNHVSSS